MIYAFGAYTLDTDRYELRQAGELCALEPHAVDILAYLLQHRERVVTADDDVARHASTLLRERPA